MVREYTEAEVARQVRRRAKRLWEAGVRPTQFPHLGELLGFVGLVIPAPLIGWMVS